MKKLNLKHSARSKGWRSSMCQFLIVCGSATSALALDASVDPRLNYLTRNAQIQQITADYNSVAKIIKGRVRDEKGEGLPSVTILIKGSTIGATTALDGTYELNIPSAYENNAVLAFSFIGYEAQEVILGNKTVIDITLKESSQLLEQLVVVGYSSKKAKFLSSSVSTITNEKLNDVTSNELSSMLQGKAPGVVVSSGSGDPTGSAKILVRGAGTLSAGTAPLEVVDGNIGGTYNPADVESVTVLKDVAATGLYGSRAANGVIIITTKQGKAGETKIEFKNSLGFAQASTGNFKLMNSQQLFDYQKDFNPRDPSVLNTNTNWWDLAFRTAVVNSHSLSASGGTDKTQFYVSGVFYREEGTAVKNDKTGYNFRANMTTKLTDKLKASVLVNGRYNNDNYHNSNTIYDAYTNLPFDPAYNTDGTPTDGRTYPEWKGRDFENFLHSIQYNYSKATSLNVNADVNLDYQLTDKITLSSYNRATFNDLKSTAYNDSRTKQGGANGGELYLTNSDYNRLLTSNRARYEDNFGNHNLAVLGVAETERTNYNSGSVSGKGLPPGRDVMSVATGVLSNPTGEREGVAFRKFLGQADYNYDNRYFLIGSLVNEFSSVFGKNNATANFYQMGASWVLTNEQFLKNHPVLTFAKLRASYGTVGNADGIGRFASLGLYSISQEASYGGLPGAAPSQKGNPDLTWEKIRSANIGMDLNLWNRIDVSLDVYDKRSSDLLYRKPLAATTGYSYVWMNAGSVRNKGFEFGLTSKNLVGELKWETNFNFALNRNKVLELSDGAQVFNTGARQPIAVGYDMDAYNMPIWAGVDPENGNPLWEKITVDADGNKTKSLTSTYGEASTTDSRQFVGKSAAPKFTGGIGNNLSYKGFSLSAFFNFVYGNYIYNDSRAYFDNDGLYESYNSMVLADGWNRWEKPGDIATHPKSVVGGNHDSNQPSTRYLENGSYIRLRNVRLGYTIPTSVVNRIGLSKVSVFVSGDNLWTGTKFSGTDPEVSLSQSNLSSGMSSMSYPTSKKYLLGVNISF